MWLILLRSVGLLLLVTAIAPLLPPLIPVAPAVGGLFHVTPPVRAILRNLRRIDLPRGWREANWTGRLGQGSCVHASLVHLFHWQGRHDLAARWRTRYAGGETPEGLTHKLNRAQIPFAETRTGDAAFLEWAVRTRRGAAVVVQNGAHMVTLVGLDEREAHLLDSNATGNIQIVPRESFLAHWRQSGGWAVTPLGTPPPPDPWIVR